ncbi:MAG: molybdopterin cofactor-binding domain-containing protein [Bdellovibrionota bacterium]
MHKDFELPQQVSRRAFLQTSLVTGGALVFAFHFGGRAVAADAAPPKSVVKYPPASFIRVEPDGTTVFQINKLEMGQGVNTSMAQILAEEMDCDWSKVRSESAPVNAVFNHTGFGTQMTGGSSALNSSYEQHRTIGAMARAMFVQAAAEKWEVPTSSLHTENGFVLGSKGKLSYAELAPAVALLSPPETVLLKDPKKFKIIGKSVERVDAFDKSTGKAKFGLDVQVPGMLYCVVARAPVFGAKVKSVNDTAAKAVSGVKMVLALPDRVAVLASNTHAARMGRDALQVDWEKTGKEGVSSASILKEYQEAAKTPGAVAEDKGDTANQMGKAKKKIEAEYVFPYLAHACMEPMNCTINFDGQTCEIWSGHQMPTIDRDTAATMLGLDKERVQVHTTYAGGSFGRRANKNSDYVVEACMIALKAKTPFKVVWTREDDMKGGYYRPFTYHKAVVGLDAKGMPHAWDHRIVGQSVVGDSFFEKMMVNNGVDPTCVEGVAGSHYNVPNRFVTLALQKQHVPVLWWRSVGHTHTAYAMETLMDEIAHNAKKDPLALRLELLKGSPRHVAVLKLLKKVSPWGKPAPKGRAYGLAIQESFNSVVGQVVEVSMSDGQPRVHRVWAAAHVGRVVNPEGAKTQLEGGILFGLSAALYGKVDIADGVPTANNFNDYPVVRMNEAPEIHSFFVDSEDKPTGLGEPGVPPLAPAVANAVFRLTKKRVRTLPFKDSLA